MISFLPHPVAFLFLINVLPYFWSLILLVYVFVALTLFFLLISVLFPLLNNSTPLELKYEISREHNLFILLLLLFSLKWFMTFVWILSLSKWTSNSFLYHWPLIKTTKPTRHLAFCNTLPPQYYPIDNNWLSFPYELILIRLNFWISTQLTLRELWDSFAFLSQYQITYTFSLWISLLVYIFCCSDPVFSIFHYHNCCFYHTSIFNCVWTYIPQMFLKLSLKLERRLRG